MERIKDCFTFIFHIHAIFFLLCRMAGAPDCELDVTSVSVCFEDQVGVDEELTESETEEASLSLQRLLTGKNFASVPKPIPIPSHKRRPVVKYEGGKSFFYIFLAKLIIKNVQGTSVKIGDCDNRNIYSICIFIQCRIVFHLFLIQVFPGLFFTIIVVSKVLIIVQYIEV